MSEGKYIERAVAASLILKLFDGQACIPRWKINEKVLELHLRRGGVSSPNAYTIIGTGLDYLKKQGKADNLEKGIWNIDSTGSAAD